MPAGQKDKPNSPSLVRKVLHRDGLRCSNPGCRRRRRLQAHHIEARCNGGPTVLTNETTVCAICHALIHKGRLKVTWVPGVGLKWQTTPVSPDAIMRDADEIDATVDDIARQMDEWEAQETAEVDEDAANVSAARDAEVAADGGAAASASLDTGGQAAQSTRLGTHGDTAQSAELGAMDEVETPPAGLPGATPGAESDHCDDPVTEGRRLRNVGTATCIDAAAARQIEDVSEAMRRWGYRAAARDSSDSSRP
jgi:hypothetical protein